MTVFELSIKESYAPKWGIWESVREIIQNALDENDRGFPMSIKHEDGWLWVFNAGANLTVGSLILGQGDKANKKELRGEHAEGLALSLLAGIRSGARIKIKTQDETWAPEIRMSSQYGTRVLTVKTRKLARRFTGVRVGIEIEKEVWESLEHRFLDLQKIPEEEITKTAAGDILLGEKFNGMLFGKGIYVESRSDFLHGYNLKNAKLDRERQLFRSFDLRWEIGKMYSLAAENAPEQIADTVYPLVKNAQGEADSFMSSNVGQELKNAVVKKFRAEHGEEAILVDDIGESAEAEHHGKKGVIVPASLRDIIDWEVQDLNAVKKCAKNEVKEVYSWQDLSNEEQLSLTEACTLFQSALESLFEQTETCKEIGVSSVWSTYDKKQSGDILDKVNIVRFGGKNIRGMTEMSTGKITVSRSELSHPMRCLTVLLHEKAHAFFGGRDTEIVQAVAVQECWCVLMYVHVFARLHSSKDGV